MKVKQQYVVDEGAVCTSSGTGLSVGAVAGCRGTGLSVGGKPALSVGAVLISLIFSEIHRNSLIFIDFHGVSSNFSDPPHEL